MSWYNFLFKKQKQNTEQTDIIEELTTLINSEEPSYFSEKELKCKCGCNACDMDPTFMKMLNRARHEDGKPWKVNSAYRCASHNSSVGGKKSSAHLHGCAVDIYAPNSTRKFEIVTSALKVGFNRIGVGKNFVHLDADTSAGHPANVLWTY